MTNYIYIGTTTEDNMPSVKKSLTRRHMKVKTVHKKDGEWGDGIIGAGYDFYVAESRAAEADTVMNSWEEKGIVVIISSAIAGGY